MAVKRTTEQERAHKEQLLRTMLKKAETTSPEEAEMIMAKVEKLMLELGIEDLMAMTEDKKSEEIITDSLFFEGVYAKAWVQMCWSIVLGLGDLQAISSDGWNKSGKKGKHITLVGYESDVKRAKILLESLSLQCVTAVSKFMENHALRSYMTPSDKYNEKRSFIVGFGRGAAERVRRTRRTVVQEATSAEPGTALVLADRKTAVDRAFDMMFSDRKNTRSMRINGSGYSRGREAGRQARTGESEVGHGRKAIG